MVEREHDPRSFHDAVAGNCGRRLPPPVLCGYRERSGATAIAKPPSSLRERRIIRAGANSVADPDATRQQGSPQGILRFYATICIHSLTLRTLCVTRRQFLGIARIPSVGFTRGTTPGDSSG